MELLLYVELNILAMIILLLIFFNVHHRFEKYFIEQNIFLGMLLVNALILITQVLIFMFSAQTTTVRKSVFLTATIIYTILYPLLCMLWSLYADYIINRSIRRFKILIIPMIIPLFINILLTFLYRNPYQILIGYFYLIITLIYSIKKRNSMENNIFISIYAFAFPPIIFGILQYTINSTAIIWISTTISILIVFINMQNNYIYKDQLTNVFNRRQLEYYLKERFQRKIDHQLIVGIMIDIQSLKKINDKLGYEIGDQTLKTMADILKKSFRKQGFIARYGSDEFVVILEVSDSTGLVKAINLLKDNVNEFNKKNNMQYEIDYSIGADYYNTKSHMSASDFLKRIESLTLKDKNMKKTSS